MSHPGSLTTSIVVPLRFRDLDTLGHVNQSVYHVILEEARMAFLADLTGPGQEFVLARVELDYRHEVRSSDRQLVVVSTVDEVGRSSIRLTSRMTVPNGTLAAEAVTVIVAWDPEGRRARPLTDDERAALERLQASQ